MAILLSLLPVLLQVGPYTPPGSSPAPRGVEGREGTRRPAPAAPATPPPPPQSTRGQACRAALSGETSEAIELAANWLASAKPEEKAEAEGCLGMAYAAAGQFDQAESALVAARNDSASSRLGRAAYGAMAGNAALAGGAADRALPLLDAAHAEAKGLGDDAMAGDIALDRSRALAALKRYPEAEAALAEARTADPKDANAWLLSATLARRMGKLAEAQAAIEKAADLLPVDPAIGLEAGVIAVLAGRDAAARRSWQSVIKASPASPEAQQARTYLAQLGPEPAPAPPAK